MVQKVLRLSATGKIRLSISRQPTRNKRFDLIHLYRPISEARYQEEGLGGKPTGRYGASEQHLLNQRNRQDQNLSTSRKAATRGVKGCNTAGRSSYELYLFSERMHNNLSMRMTIPVSFTRHLSLLFQYSSLQQI